MSKYKARPKSPFVDLLVPARVKADVGVLCGWELRESDGDSRIRSVRSLEGIHGSKPKLLTLSTMATAQNHSKEGAYSRLNRLRHLDDSLSDEISEEGWKLHESIMDLMGDQPSGTLASIHARTSTARDAAELQVEVRSIFSDRLLAQLPHSSVHVIEVSETLTYRYQVIRALVPTYEQHGPGEENLGRLYASNGLFNDTTVGRGCYIDLLATSLTPHPWGLPVGRPGCVIMYIFGETIPGHRGVSADPILLYGSSRGTRPIADIAHYIPPAAFTEAANWWVKQLELVFSMITEPGNYAVSGRYDPHLALEKILSLEQFFRGCQSISVGGFDQHASRLTLFTVLEILGGLSARLKWESLTSAAKARVVLEDLKSVIPGSVHAVLLPRAEAAVDALEQLQEGFFLPDGKESNGLPLPRSQGGSETVSLDKAVSSWLRVIRNSHHGFDKKSSARDRALLGSHNGDFPPHLPDLAWLYLLHLMANPDLLRRHPPVGPKK